MKFLIGFLTYCIIGLVIVLTERVIFRIFDSRKNRKVTLAKLDDEALEDAGRLLSVDTQDRKVLMRMAVIGILIWPVAVVADLVTTIGKYWEEVRHGD